jgi:acyl transferase domain-containing protein
VAEAGAFGVPLQAIVHAAGVLDDAAIDNLDTARLRAVAAAKVDGARALHAAAPEVRMVLFSSATAWLGAHGQGNYGAANAWLDAFAERRPNTVSLGFGPWSGTGMAADQLATMRAGGIKPLVPAAAVAAMARAWGAEGAVAIADANWDTWRTTYAPRRARAGLDLLVSEEAPVVTKPRATRAARNQMGSAVREAVARTLGLDDPAAVDPHQGLFDLGLDSLMAVALVERLEALSGLELPASVVFDHPTADGLSKHLLGLLGDGDEADAVETAVTARDDEPIAIVGFACRFPGADDADAFWQLLVDGRCAIGEAPRDRWPELDGLYDPMPGTPGRTYTTEGGFVGDIAGFDAGFFGISPREARAMDPQQRLLLEVSWHALEHAGYAPPDLRGRAAGVYVGMGASEYDGRFQRRVEDTIDAYSGTGNDTSFAAGRVAYVLGLHGPALSVNTACSASLVTVDLACRDLRDGVTSLALAGGVNLMVSSDSTVRLAQLRALSPTARCRAFDADADGYVRGEGCGMVVLERLSDARANGHHVYAVVRGSAVNHDGASSALTVPNGTAQTALLRAAWQRAGITGDDLGYLEAHGTGTKLGDPIEARSLAAALGERATPLPVGSVKTNVGHLELAAGVAGLLKTVLALHHGVIPPHLHLRRRNPEIPESLPLRFPSEAEPWSGPRVAGISSFGLSGTNAHLVLAGGEAPHAEAVAGPPDRPVHLLCLGARSAGALDALAAGVAGRLDEGLADVAASANRTRVSGHHRLAVVGADADAVAAALEGRSRDGLVRAEAPPAPPRMAWLFPGQGERMAFPVLEALATHPAARAVLAELDDAVRQLAGVDLLALAGDLPRLSALPEAGAVLVSVEIVLATLWRAWGAEPDEVVGHGVGEVAAAWAAGRLSAGDAVRVAWLRGEAVAAEAPAGRLLAVRADAASVVAALDVLAVDGAAVAAVNDPRTTVVAVPEAGAGALREGLVARGLTAMPVPGGHAFHTPGMAAAASRFRRALLDVAAEDGHTPWRWASDGTLVPAGLEALADALEGPLRFVDAVRAVEAAGVTVLVELAPRPVLLGMARRGLSPRGRAFLPSAMPDRPWEALLEAVGAAWTRGVEVDLQAFDAPWSRRRVALPFTPFERRRYWVDESVAAPVARAMTVAAPQRDLPPEERIREVVARLLGTEPSAVPLDRPLAWQGLDSMMATELHRTLEQVFGTTVPLDEVLTGPSIRQLTELLR